MAAVLLTQFLLGCTGWQVQDLTPEQVIEEHRPRKILITTVEDSKIELQSPIAVVGDTLTGWMGRRPNPLTPVKLPLDSVKTVAVSRTRTGVFVALILASLVTAGAVIVISIVSQME
jgi:hypothetical protein